MSSVYELGSFTKNTLEDYDKAKSNAIKGAIARFHHEKIRKDTADLDYYTSPKIKKLQDELTGINVKVLDFNIDYDIGRKFFRVSKRFNVNGQYRNLILDKKTGRIVKNVRWSHSRSKLSLEDLQDGE